MKTRLVCLPAGLVSYSKGLELQKQVRQKIEAGKYDGALLLLEHLPVITAGRSGGRENLIATLDDLKGNGIEFFESDRGGNITCHNPGQLVGYPIMNLGQWQEDVHWYVEQLEEVLIRTIAEFGIRAGRKAKYTGVWVGNRKIAAIGVSVRRWITGHGFSLNVNNDLEIFHSIVPCGIGEFGVTSIKGQGVRAEVQEVAVVLSSKFGEVFDSAIDLSIRSENSGEK